MIGKFIGKAEAKPERRTIQANQVDACQLRLFATILGLDEHLTPQRSNGLRSMVARIKDREYADRQLTTFPGGFVQQHVLKGKRVHDDGAVRLPCAIICKVENGKITRLDEYFDSAHVAEFRKFANA